MPSGNQHAVVSRYRRMKIIGVLVTVVLILFFFMPVKRRENPRIAVCTDVVDVCVQQSIWLSTYDLIDLAIRSRMQNDI